VQGGAKGFFVWRGERSMWIIIIMGVCICAGIVYGIITDIQDNKESKKRQERITEIIKELGEIERRAR